MDAIQDPADRSPHITGPLSYARREPLLTPEEVSGLTGLSIETLAQWRSQRRGIPFLKISRNCVRYRQDDLNEWLQSRLIVTTSDNSSLRR